MQQELKNIFVTKEVAKLAKEKGFNEWCVAYYSIRYGTIFPNIDGFGNLLNDCDNPHEFIELPTNFQLIQWLEGKGYFVCQAITNWRIYSNDGYIRFAMAFDTINDALIFALNKINQNQNGK